MSDTIRIMLTPTIEDVAIPGGFIDLSVEADDEAGVSIEVPAAGGGSVVVDPVALGIGTSHGILIVAPTDILIKPTNLSSPVQGRVFLLASGLPADIMPAPGAETYTLSGVAAVVTIVRVIVWGT